MGLTVADYRQLVSFFGLLPSPFLLLKGIRCRLQHLVVILSL